MTWASADDLSANRAGRVTDAQHARLTQLFVRPARTRAWLGLLAMAIGLAMFMGPPEQFGVALVLVVVGGLISYGSVSGSRALVRDLAAGAVRTKTATLTPMSDARVRAETHWVRVDGDKIHFGHITGGTEREWFVRGGTFRFHYLPLSGRLLTYEHLDE